MAFNSNNINNDVLTLQKWATNQELSQVQLNSTGTELTKDNDGITLVANVKHTIVGTDTGKSCDYTLGSIYLQILDPAQGLMGYRSACKQHGVTDPVKASDKATVLSFFLGSSSLAADASTAAATAVVAPLLGASDAAATATVAPGASNHNNVPDQMDTTTAAAAATTTTTMDGTDVATLAKSKDRHHRQHHHDKRHHHESSKHSRKHHHSSSSSSKRSSSMDAEQAAAAAKKKSKTMTTEMLFNNLVTVVDKRSNNRTSNQQQEQQDQAAAIVAALSTEGFEVPKPSTNDNDNAAAAASTADVLSKYRQDDPIQQQIMANETPVGNSASVLKAAAGKDLSRVLKLYLEVIQPPSSATGSKYGTGRGGNSATATTAATMNSSLTEGKASWRPYLVGKKPIIIVPKGMTAPLTLLNAHEFFGNARYIPRDIMMKKQQQQQQAAKAAATAAGGNINNNNKKPVIPTTFHRRVGQRLGGGMVEYEILDNPTSGMAKLQTSKDWDRVVAVVCLGQAWQFKDWPGHYSDPVRLFASVFGFYVGMEGAKVPNDLQSWAVTQAKLNRDKRGMDSVAYASFWNGLDEFMAIHKPELLPQPGT